MSLDAGTPQANATGIPGQVKKNVEAYSGFSFDDVRIHYNSARPAQVHALAYTQGNQVYLGPGQQSALGHELGHVVQQKQGRVQATGQVKGQPLNDDRKLELEADRIGSRL